MLHNMTKPLPWRGGAQVIDDVLEDVQPEKSGRNEARMERPRGSRHARRACGKQRVGE